MGFMVGEGLRRLPLTHLEILAARDSTTAAAVMELQKSESAVAETSSRRRDTETPGPGFSPGPASGPCPGFNSWSRS